VTREEVLQSLLAVLDRPASTRELLQALKIPRETRATFRRHLHALAAEGALVQVRGHRYALPGRADATVGVLQVHPDGYGFVTPDGGGEPGDIYIGRTHLKEAMHGDRVAVQSVRDQGAGRREGRVARVIERGPARILGQVRIDRGGRIEVIPHDRRLTARVTVPPGESRGASAGDVVELEITRWPTATRGPTGRVTEVLGQIDAPGVDTTVVLRKHGIVEEPSPAAVAEARWLGPSVRQVDLEGRTDFRSDSIVTIDGEDARDFDDAVSVVKLDGGRYRLAVHIADVSHYVRPGSALDEDARDRGTSVYFPDRAVHMLPAEIAAGLCSLKPGVDRLVQSCIMDIDARGEVARFAFHDGVIRSRARLTYTEVNAFLTGEDPDAAARLGGLRPMLVDMRGLFEVLHERRRRRGSIDFDLPESEIVLDDEGRVAAITRSERNIAHRLIEEFMLLANETVAGDLERRGIPSIYRIHEAPDPAKVAAFVEFVSTLGHALGAGERAPRPRDFQALIDKVAGSPVERPVAFLMLRTMQQARYDAVNLGHFGLAAPTYTHFTSPIRRYPDLVVHRVLRESRGPMLSAERRDALEAALPEIARHASERERRAVEAERELVRWKQVRFMADKVGGEYEGYVTGVSSFGLFIELVEHFVEGLAHISGMADDEYRYVEAAHAIHGARSRRIYRLGDRVRVQVLKVDPDRRLIDLGLVEQIKAMIDGRRRGPGGRHRSRPGSDRRRHSPRQPPRRRPGRHR
jgi:ribonuclease R